MALYEHVFLTRQDAAPAQVEALTEQYKGLIAAGGAIANGTTVWAGSDLLGLNYLAPQVLVTAMVLVIGFALNRSWTFA